MYIFFSYPAICVLRNTQIAEQKEEKKKKKVRLRWFRYRWWWWTTSFDRICLTVFFLFFFFLLRCSYNLFALFSHAQVHHILLIESFFFFQQIGEEECGRGSRNQWFSQWAHTYRKRQRATPPSTLSSVAKSQGDRCGVESKKKRKTGGCFFPLTDCVLPAWVGSVAGFWRSVLDGPPPLLILVVLLVELLLFPPLLLLLLLLLLLVFLALGSRYFCFNANDSCICCSHKAGPIRS